MLEKISAYAQTSKSSKAAIAKGILENLSTIEKMSLEDLAKASYSSKSSIVRFAQTLGYKGWTDFLPALLSERYYFETHYSDIDHSLPFSEADSTRDIIQKIATIEKESIQDTADQIKGEDLEIATAALFKAKRVVVFGLSPNDYLAHLFKRNMLTIGKVVEIANNSEFGLSAASMQAGDLAIIISYSGNSKGSDSLKHIESLKEKHVYIIGLTSKTGYYLQNYSDVVFTICDREDKQKKIGNFSTEQSIHFILNALYALYFKQDFMRNYVRKINLSNHLEHDR